MNKAYVVLSV